MTKLKDDVPIIAVFKSCLILQTKPLKVFAIIFMQNDFVASESTESSFGIPSTDTWISAGWL